MENVTTKEHATKRRSNFWEILNSSVVIAALVSGIITWGLTCANNKHNETLVKINTNQRYVEFAVGILRDSSENIDSLKDWAMDIIDTCGPIKLSPGARRALKESPLDFYTSCPPGTVLGPDGWSCTPIIGFGIWCSDGSYSANGVCN